MQHNNANDKWYAAFVLTGEEDNVKERLKYKFRDKNLRVLVPKRKLRERKNGIWENRVRTLLPGYVLLNGRIGIEEYYYLKGIPGLVRILSDKSEPLEINKDEISVISKLICNDEIVGTSNVLIDGSRVEVIDGPLLGLDGLIESIDKRKGRAKVRLNLLGEPRVVELSISTLQSA
ncbi:MAG: antiterminator LoaP [Clostridia bacterium]|nr:antiterminator LoaP [Clostridia bacterium]